MPAAVCFNATPASSGHKPAEIRRVWARNLEQEFDLIGSIADRFPFASIDTEFPGVVRRSLRHPSDLYASERYADLKSNVDQLHLIQLGLTLSNGTDGTRLVWEFNFREFDPLRHPHAPDSINLLRSNGLDFELFKSDGIDIRRFGELMMSSGLVCQPDGPDKNWVSFHGAYDFGYLIKALTGQKLPDTMEDFLALVRLFFGSKVFDVKYMMRHCQGLFGGLDRVAFLLNVERENGSSHQAGSDSLVTLDVFRRMLVVFFENDQWGRHTGVIFGLEVC